MENNVDYVMRSTELREGAQMLAARAVATATALVAQAAAPGGIARGGRKAHALPLDDGLPVRPARD